MRKFLPVLLMVACAHKPDTKPEAKAQERAPAPAIAASSPAATGPKSCSADLECGDKQLCIRGACVDITPDLAECRGVRVHFPFNSSEMDPAELPGLQRSARCLKADRAMKVTIEGNADERGTEEYNLALGDQRAASVAKYLESLGVSDGQLKTVSYGKENPICSDHDEACWSRNRRAELNASSKKKRN
jgi:peptidoglycan-associated lipoprotein